MHFKHAEIHFPEPGVCLKGHITKEDLRPGDVLLIMDDGFGVSSASYYWDGESLVGGEAAVTGAEADALIEGLFAKYAFLLLRPAQAL